MPSRIETNNGVLEQHELPDHSSALFLGDQHLFNEQDAGSGSKRYPLLSGIRFQI